MTQTTNTLGELSTEQRSRLEAWLMEFDAAWKRGLFQEYVGSVPAELASFSSVCLLELAKVDVDRRWGDGERITVEEYLRDVPALGTVESVSAELLLAEYVARKSAGEGNVSQGLFRRFPHRASELKRLLLQERPGESIARRVSQARDTQTGKGDTQSVAQQAVSGPVRKTALESTVGSQSGEIPTNFGRYKIERQLGRGAMGAVYLAEDTQLHRQVALKTPNFTGSDSAGLIDRFYREAHAAANLRHANICPVYDVGEIDGRHFITMAYIDGRELSNYIKPGEPTAERAAATLIRKLALALQYAHDIGTVHRDLKPANIMIDRRKEPIIMDFGLARKLDTSDQSRATQQGMLLGTPAYMSPEQVEGDLNAGEQSDIYALGVILYELLTGRLPFEGTVTAIIGQKLVKEPPKPSEFRPDLDPALEAVCLKMMARSRDERYASMKDAAAALTDYLKQPRSKVTPSVQRANDDAGLQALFQTVGEERNSLAPSKRVPSQSWSDRWKSLPPLAKWSALGGLAAVLVLSVVLIFRRPDGGTLRIEVDDPNLTVLLNGDELTLTDKSWEGKKKDQKHQLAVKVGDQTLTIGSPTKITLNDGRTVTHKLTLTLNGAELSSDSFEIVRGETTVVKIRLETEQTKLGGGKKQPSNNNSNPWPQDAPPFAVAPFDAATAKKHQQAWAKYLGVPVEYTNRIGMKFRLIPPGEFLMGSTPEEIKAALQHKFLAEFLKKDWEKQFQSEGPQHKVILTQPLYLGATEVTQAQYEKVMGANPSFFSASGQGKDIVGGLQTGEHPVENVTWLDAAEFCARLSQQERLKPFYFRSNKAIMHLKGTGYRLPTDAEWEYACRAGTTTRFWSGDQESDLVRVGWISKNSGGKTHMVGNLPANPFGLFDIHGNVWEFVQDGWDPEFHRSFSRKVSVDPSNPFQAGSERIWRGGSWKLDPTLGGRSSSRYASSYAATSNPRSGRWGSVGFRVVLPVDAVKKLAGGSPLNPVASAGEWVDLISQIDVKRDAKSGRWTKEGNSLKLVGGPGSNPLLLPFKPDGSYEIEASFTRHDLSWDHPVAFTLPGANFVEAAFSGAGRNQLSGLFGSGNAAKLRATQTAVFQIQKEKRHTVSVRVVVEGKLVRIAGIADGKPLFTWFGDVSQLGDHEMYRKFGKNPVLECLGTGRTTIHAIRWRPLSETKIEKKTVPSPNGAAGWPLPPEWKIVAFRGHYYAVVSENLQWQAAYQRCRQFGGELVSAETAAELDFVKGLIKDAKLKTCRVGGIERQGKGWQWVSGIPIDKSLWAPGEPNNFKKDERFAVIDNRRGVPHLIDATDLAAPFICEWIKNPTEGANDTQLPNVPPGNTGPIFKGEVRVFDGHSDVVSAVKFSADGRFLISSSHDKTVKYWDATTGRCLNTLMAHQGSVRDVDISPDGTFAISVGGGGMVHRWSLNKRSADERLSGPKNMVRAVAIHPNGKQAIAGGDFGELYLWDPVTRRFSRPRGVGSSSVFAVAYSENGKFAASGGYKKIPLLWDSEKMTVVTSLPATSEAINAVSISNDGRRMLVSSGLGKGHMTQLYETQNRKVLAQWPDVIHATMSSDGMRALAVKKTATVVLLDLKPSPGTIEIHQFSQRVTSIALSGDGRLGAFGFADGSIRLLRLPSGDSSALDKPSTTRENTIKALLQSGATITVQAAGQEVDVDAADKLPAGPFNVVGIRLKKLRYLTDADIARLAQFPELQQLVLSKNGSAVNDESLRHISGLTKLDYLMLRRTSVTDAGMKHLSRLTDLRMLSLIGTRVGDDGLKELAGLTNLTWLGLYRTEVGDAGLKHLAGMQSLTILYIANTNVTGRDLSALVKLTALQKLSLGGDKFDAKSADLTSLKKLKQLKQLWVSPGALTTTELDRWTKELPGVRIIAGEPDEEETESTALSPSTQSIPSALQFDGKTSYVEIPTFKFDGSHPITLEAIVDMNPIAGQPMTLFWNLGHEGLQFRTFRDKWWFKVAHDGGARNVHLAGEIKGRMHVAAVWNGPKDVRRGEAFRIYINGVMLRKGLIGNSKVSNTALLPLIFGGEIGTGEKPTSLFRGRLHELRISKTARYARNFKPQSRADADSQTLVLYHVDEGSGTVLKDLSGNGHHGRIVNAKWVSADGSELKPAAAKGESGEGWTELFDGKTLADWKSTDTHPKAWSVQNESIIVEGQGRGYLYRDFPAKDFEVSLEYRTLKPSNRGVIARAPDKQLGEKKAIEFTLIDRASLSQTLLQQDGGVGLPPESPDQLASLKQPPGKWNHVKLRMQGGQGELWFNGQLVAKKNASPLARLVPQHTYFTREAVRVVLQHCGTERVEFRNIRVRGLPPAQQTPVPNKAKQPRGKGFGGGGFGGGGFGGGGKVGGGRRR